MCSVSNGYVTAIRADVLGFVSNEAYTAVSNDGVVLWHCRMLSVSAAISSG
jgi:hypothetical protein